MFNPKFGLKGDSMTAPINDLSSQTRYGENHSRPNITSA